MQVVGLRQLFIGLILISSTFSFISTSVVSAEQKHHTIDEGNDFWLINKQGQVYNVDEFNEVRGITTHNSPFFTYRVEGFDATGNYFYGTTKSVMSESLDLMTNQNTNLWEWSILIDIYSECSCIIQISQLEGNFEIIESTSLALWIKSPNDLHESLSYPILIEDSHYPTSEPVDNPHMVFNEYLNIYADIYYPSESIGFNTTFDGGTSVRIFDYVSSEISYLNNDSEMTTSQSQTEDGNFKIHFSMNLENYSEGLFGLHFNSNYILRWNFEYFFEIDRTLPIPIINADFSVDESLEWVFVNASESFDPASSNDLIFSWTFEEPNGAIRVPSEDMVLAPDRLQFLPLINGDYIFTVYVTDKASNVNQTSHKISVNNVAPIAVISLPDGEISEGDNFDYYRSENKELIFSAENSSDTSNEIEDLQYGWYIDGLLHSSTNNSVIAVEDLKDNVELELVVKDSDGDLDTISIFLNQLDASPLESSTLNGSNTNFMNGLNLVLLTAFICTIVLLFVKRKSIQENPLPKWSKYNKKQ